MSGASTSGLPKTGLAGLKENWRGYLWSGTNRATPLARASSYYDMTWQARKASVESLNNRNVTDQLVEQNAEDERANLQPKSRIRISWKTVPV